jgi:putative DNA-invertase from lambdoid prophage Rac
MAVYGYVRVSTKAQAEDGLSLEAQERQLNGYAMMQGLQVDELFIEKGVSGAKCFASRPEGSRLFDVMKSGDTLICSKLDRLFRSARDALTVSDELKQKGVSLHLLDLGGDVTGNGISKMFFTIVASFAEFERDRIAERISDVKSNEKEKGRYLGGTRPFGYQIADDGSLTKNKGEQSVIKQIFKLRKTGLSYRKIVESLSEDVQISHVAVRKILLRNAVV